MIFGWFIDNKLRNSFMFAISFNIVLLIPRLHQKCIIIETMPSISENKEIKNIQ
jgi:hypothetical protein